MQAREVHFFPPRAISVIDYANLHRSRYRGLLKFLRLSGGFYTRSLFRRFRRQCLSKSPNAVSDVAKDGSDPGRVAIVAVHDEPDPGARGW